MENLKVVKVFFSKYDAQIAQGLLKDSGIDSIIPADDMGGYADLTLCMGNIKLLVKESDLEKAKKILVVLDEEADDKIINEINNLSFNKDNKAFKEHKKKHNQNTVFIPIIILFIFMVIYGIKERKKENYSEIKTYGNIECKDVFTNGVKNSVCKSFYKNGEIKWIAEAVNNKWNGSLQTFYYDGKLESEIIYEEGHKDGKWEIYYNNGKLKLDGIYKNDNKEGIVKEYYESGKLKALWNFKKNKYDGRGAVYYENGKLAQEVLFKNDKRLTTNGQYFDGQDKLFFENGKLWLVENYKNGLLEGKYEEYFEDGKLKKESTYKNGKLIGLSIEYYAQGKQKSVIEHRDNGKIKSIIEYDEAGNLIFKEKRHD